MVTFVVSRETLPVGVRSEIATELDGSFTGLPTVDPRGDLRPSP